MSIRRHNEGPNSNYLQVIPLYSSVLFSKCTSIHCSLHPCLPLIWIISDCLLMMSIQRNMKTSTSLLQVIPLYISKLLSKCTSIYSSLHPCLPLLWIISDCLLVMSIQRYMKTPTCQLQVIPLYISKLLSKCTSIHCSLHPCLPLLWIISDCFLMMSIQRYMKAPT